MPFDPAHDLERIPSDPGVYLMKGKDAKVFYVGKAANLKARVRQYFGATTDRRLFVGMLDRLLDDIECLITHTEKEALILENELIKRHQPRFNVELKDDKNFLHLRIDERVDWPRIDVVRRPKRDGARYFGPYHSASRIRETLKLVERHFQLRNCDDLTFRNRSRPCLQHQIERCPAPCVLPASRQDYRESVGQALLFLSGRHSELRKRLEARMHAASERLEFERAAHYRDQIRSITSSLEPQQVVTTHAIDRDVYGLYREGGLLQIAILFVRRGRLVGSRTFDFDEQETPTEEVISTFCNLFYHAGNDVPDEVLVPERPLGCDALTERLVELRGRRVEVRVPQRGAGKRLLDMAERNAEHAFFQAQRSDSARQGTLGRLKKRLALANLPVLAECFDISLFQGAAPVASKVVFEGGMPKRSAYRRYKIREIDGNDDFGMMREVLTRRLSRGLSEQDLPNLVVVDGGKGQLGVALAVLEDLGIEGVDVVALAKSRVLRGDADPGSADGSASRSPERVFLPGRRDPVVLRSHTDELFFMTHLRDEAHRFAITFHRKLRSGASFESLLDGIEGVGPARKRALLRAFGSSKRLAQAAQDEIAAVEGIGPVLARSILEGLNPGASDASSVNS